MSLFVDLLHYFLIYAFVGWCLEVIYAAVTLGKFVNRGFLAGPVCPIYGFGMVIIVLVLTPIAHRYVHSVGGQGMNGGKMDGRVFRAAGGRVVYSAHRAGFHRNG